MKRFAFAAVLLLLMPVAASAADAPLYTSFLAVCVATGGAMGAVEDAVEAAGGKSISAPDDLEPGSAVSIAAWEYRTGGEDLTVVAGTQNIPDANGGKPRDATACIIQSQPRDDAGAFAIKQWVGVPPSHIETRETTVTRFDFRIAGAAHTPAPADRSAYDAAVSTGQIWSLVLRQTEQATSVQFIHIVPEVK